MGKRWRIILIVLFGFVLLTGASFILFQRYINNKDTHTSLAKKPSSKLPTVSSEDKTIAHVFIIMEENKPISLINGNAANAPYINSLISKYGIATNYNAVAHPSLPNYLAITSGSTDGITTDCNPPSAGCTVNVKNIADEIESSGRTWKEYAESMPSACYMYNSGNYATKHNPFIYYSDIANNKARCDSHVVPFTQLSTDLRSVRTTPNYAFITPNLCNDMHNCSIEVGDYWLSQTVPMILNSKAFTTQPSLLIITWDEGYASNNNVAAIVAGSAAKNKYVSNKALDHYSVLSTIESIWGLKPLTQNDKNAPTMLNFVQ